MAEYINREQLLELINEDCKYKNPTNEYTRGCNEVCDWVIKTIKNIPTADVQEVRHAKFELVYDGKGVCNNCHRLDSIDKLAKYCRYCGAKMDKDKQK